MDKKHLERKAQEAVRKASEAVKAANEALLEANNALEEIKELTADELDQVAGGVTNDDGSEWDPFPHVKPHPNTPINP